MKPIVPEAIEQYVAAHSPPESALSQALVKETYATMQAPHMQVGRVEGALLRLLVRLTGAHRVLEIGTFTGYSALAMAEGLPSDGALITCDIDPKVTAIAQRYFDQSEHGKKISVRLAPALETMATLEAPFDLAFIDADKANYINYWNAIVPKVRSGGVIVADNTLWSGTVLTPADDTARAVAAFNEHVQHDARVESVMLTVRDGLTVGWKR